MSDGKPTDADWAEAKELWTAPWDKAAVKAIAEALAKRGPAKPQKHDWEQDCDDHWSADAGDYTLACWEKGFGASYVWEVFTPADPDEPEVVGERDSLVEAQLAVENALKKMLDNAPVAAPPGGVEIEVKEGDLGPFSSDGEMYVPQDGDVLVRHGEETVRVPISVGDKIEVIGGVVHVNGVIAGGPHD